MASTSLPPPPTSTPGDLYRWLYLLYQSVNNSNASALFGPAGVVEPRMGIRAGASRNLDYLSLAVLALNGISVTSTANEINQLHGSGITEATLAALQSSATGAASASFTISGETSDTITVSVQFLTSAGLPVSSRIIFDAYLSDNASGSGHTVTPPNGGGVISGTSGSVSDIATVSGTSIIFKNVTNSSGKCDMVITNSTTATWYLVVAIPGGKTVVSSAISFS